MPDEVQRAFDGIGLQVYNTMNGPSEFHVVGTLKDWDIRDRLGEIRIPTLITSGRYDELTPMQGEIVNRGIPNSRWVIFEESSHMPHVEEETRYLAVLEDFLRRIEDPE
jgi:L-proline amide hydrolase